MKGLFFVLFKIFHTFSVVDINYYFFLFSRYFVYEGVIYYLIDKNDHIQYNQSSNYYLHKVDNSYL